MPSRQEDIGIGRALTVSVTIAPFVDGDLLTAVSDADRRLSRAKTLGRDRVVDDDDV